MNTSTIRVLAMFSLIATLGPVGAMAQGPAQFTIPFDFTVGSKSMVAGKYVVRELSPDILQIQSRDGRANTMVLAAGTEPGSIRSLGVMTFQKYGDQYFLSSVQNSDRGWRMPQSKRERELIAERAYPKHLDLVASSRN
jgi:hypothetical protein